MRKIFKYSHLSAKISAMKGKMLNEADYQAMMSKHNVSEVATYLKSETYYQNAFQTLNEKDVHRAYLEVLLYRAEISDALKISKYLKGNDKELYRYVYRKQEIEDIKNMLRILHMGKQLKEIDRKSLFISKFSKIDFNEALKSKNIQELVESVKGTNFYEILAPFVLGENHIDLFSAEMALDMYYYTKLVSSIESILSGQDLEVVRTIFGVEADIKNILLIYRGKKYFETYKELPYRYLIPLAYKLKKDEIRKLVEAHDEQEVMDLIAETFYGKVLGSDPKNWEYESLKFMLKIQNRNVKLDRFSLAPVIGYIVLKDMEINNIISIIEGIRYQVSPEEIRKQLIGRSL